MQPLGWKLRAKVFAQRFWQPTSACMTCMTGSLANVMSAAHWKLALQTGLGTGVLALLLTLTPIGKLFGHRYGNAVLVAALTAIADAWSHPGRYAFTYGEAILTGAVSGVFALCGSFLFEDRARRLRAAWSRLTGARRRV